jgi:hypothetical protein
MSSATTALRLFALEDNDLASMLVDRLRPMNMAQLDEMPCAIFETIDSVPDEALDGDMSHQTDRVQYDVFDSDPDRCYAIARRLRGVMLDAYGILPADLATEDNPDPPVCVITGMSTAGGIRDYPPESPIDGSDVWRYRRSFDLLVSFNP